MGYNQGHSISGRQAPFATICAEVLDRILSNFEYYKDVFDHTAYDVYLPFTLVNHHWYAVANRRLYLYVASDKAHNAEILLNTLRARPDLAGTVRSIKFGTLFFDREETENHAAIVQLCRNLVALDLSGWNGFILAPLVEAVRGAHTLKSISIDRYGLCDDEGDTFCSASESDSNGESDDEPGNAPEEWKRQSREIRARLKVKWKETRRVLAERRQFDQTTDWLNATPCLRDVQFSGISDSLDNTFLGRLVTMAPNLQHFRASIALYALEGLRLCLRTWRHSLRTLHISIPWLDYKPADGDAKSAGIDDAVSELTALQALAVSDVLFLPGTLRRCVAPIENIHYQGSAEQMQELVDVLSSPDVLPTLRVFRSFDPHLELETVLRARNVSVNPQLPSEPLKEKVLSYYGDNSESDDGPGGTGRRQL
ncbi:hypothetical protein FISHEDRAFT_68749 [Fistulina hepatica ATCC 64428]|uniref:F-box domain-containing protein n=1 Tax=Fistulina hepatica ATCC 64428 TaxID=1128425 RepID=A0A0D7ART9_9AGAR|nr:hypothetical protein FISHEDRAFT_68749 [Fistulina hepatica ATCC 64428]